MNIAILIPTLTTGGAERAAVTVGKHFYENGHNVYYFLFSNSGKCFYDVRGTVVKTHITYPFSQGEYIDNIRELFFASKTLRKLKKRYHIDASISFMEAWNMVNVCSRCKDRVVISVRTVLSKRSECAGFLYDKKVIKSLYNRADCIVGVSEGVKADLISEYGINKRKVVAIPNPSIRHEDTGANENAWRYGKNTVLCIGRLDPVKQFHHVIRAFRYVVERLPEARLVIVGNGRQMSYLKSESKRCGVEQYVTFEGAQNNIGYYLKNARCFVMTSKVEGFPNAMVEAMAFGIPVISTDSPGGCGEIIGKMSEEVIDGLKYCKYGVLTPYINSLIDDEEITSDKEKILADAMYIVLKDDGLNKQISDKSKERAMYYSEKNIMEKWNGVVK